MRYLSLQIHTHEYHEALCYCFVPLCDEVCQFVTAEAYRFLKYMVRDRFHVTSIDWKGSPALHWYEQLPAGIAATDGYFPFDVRDDFGEELRVLELAEDFAWPANEAENHLLLLSNAEFVASRARKSPPDLWVLWSAVLIENDQGYEYHTAAVPLRVFEEWLANCPRLCSDRSTAFVTTTADDNAVFVIEET